MQEKCEFPVIETQRLILRVLTLDERDVKDVFKHFSDDEVTKYMDIEPCNNLSDAEEIIRFHVEDSGCRWGIFKKEDHSFIGTGGFHCWDKKNRTAEIGYDLGKAFWGQGFMHEALQSMILFGFESMGLTTIEASVEVDNTKSIKLMEKFSRDYEISDGQVNYYLINDSILSAQN